MNIHNKPTKIFSEVSSKLNDGHAVTCNTTSRYFDMLTIPMGHLQTFGAFGGIDYIIQIDEGQKKFYCTYIPNCTKNYGSKSHVNRHIDIKHKDIKPFECNEAKCEFRTPYKSHLESHSWTHSGEKPFECDFKGCEASYAHKDLLLGHSFSHTDSYRYNCDYEKCEYGNNYKVNLNAHIRSNHTGEKPYVCECGYETAHLSNLKLHQRYESGYKPYICQNCGYSTPGKGHLNRHIISETKDYPHRCPFCEWGTPSLRRLNDHVNSHTKDNVYPCLDCSKPFYSEESLKLHVDKASCIFPKFQWKEWEILCLQHIAPIIYKDLNWEPQPKIETPEAELNWIEPELVINHDDGSIEFVDAKRNATSVSPKDLNIYPMYCDAMTFWILYGKSKKIEYKGRMFEYVSSGNLIEQIRKSGDENADQVISMIQNLKTSKK